MSEDLDDIFDDFDQEPPPAPPAAVVDLEARAAARMVKNHPDFDSPGPDDHVPDYVDEFFHPSERPLEILRAHALPQEDAPEAGLLYRPDGRGLFYMGAVNSIAGDPGVGKTFAALLAVLAALAQGRHVLLIDYEDTPGRLVARLVSLGVNPALLELVHLVKDPDHLWETHVAQLVDYVTEWAIAVVVIDSVTPAVESHDLDENSGGDYSRWHRTVPTPLARTGACVILIDHRPKPPTGARGVHGRGLWAAGSRHKLAGIDGVAYVLEARDSFSRADPGKTARLDLMVAKDRHGAIGGRGDIVARFELTPTTEGAVSHNVALPPAAGHETDPDTGERLTGADNIKARRTEALKLIEEVYELELKAKPTAFGASTRRIEDFLRNAPLEKLDGPPFKIRKGDLKGILYAWADAGYLDRADGPGNSALWRPHAAEVIDLFSNPAEPELDEEPF